MKNILSYIQKILNDTLKKNGLWSRMSIMMMIAWNTAIIMAIEDYSQHGIRMDVWMTLVTFALGNKTLDALNNKIATKKEKTDDTN